MSVQNKRMAGPLRPAPAQPSRSYTRSEIARMSAVDYAAAQDDILLALAAGKVTDDLAEDKSPTLRKAVAYELQDGLRRLRGAERAAAKAEYEPPA